MKTLLLMSILFAAIALPIVTARDPDPRRGVRRLLVLLLIFHAVYLIHITMLHPILFVPQRPGSGP